MREPPRPDQVEVRRPSRDVRPVDDLDLFVDYDAPVRGVDLERLLDRAEAALSTGTVPEQEILRLWWGTAGATPRMQGAVAPLYALLDDWYERVAPDAELRVHMAAAARRARALLDEEQRP